MQERVQQFIEMMMKEEHDGHGHHVTPLFIYYGIYGALLVLTVLTVLVSYANLGPLSFPVAMIVATIKASLVAGFFMHLHYDDKFNSVIFGGSLVFLLIFFVFTGIDLATRSVIVPETGNFVMRKDKPLQPTFVYPQSAGHGEGHAESGAGHEEARGEGAGHH